MTTYGIIFMSVASELSLVKIFCKSLRADPATKTTDDLDGVFMPWVPRFRWRGCEVLRDRWWEGRCPGYLKGGNVTRKSPFIYFDNNPHKKLKSLTQNLGSSNFLS